MKPIVLFLGFLILGICGYLSAWHWAVRSVAEVDLNGPMPTIEKIRHDHIILLADPEGLVEESDHGTNLVRWIFTEIHRRLGVVFLVWSLLAFSLWFFTFGSKSQKNETG